jgi:hypothetical protein
VLLRWLKEEEEEEANWKCTFLYITVRLPVTRLLLLMSRRRWDIRRGPSEDISKSHESNESVNKKEAIRIDLLLFNSSLPPALSKIVFCFCLLMLE